MQGASGAVGGFIDSVQRSAAGPIIRDYKTGSVHGESAAVKPEYATQLKLYAALYAEQYGI